MKNFLNFIFQIAMSLTLSSLWYAKGRDLGQSWCIFTLFFLILALYSRIEQLSKQISNGKSS